MPDNDYPEGTYLAFDYGVKRIGVAKGQTISRSASPLKIVQAGTSTQWNEITALIQEWAPAALVVGIPYTEDGTTTPHIKKILKFIEELKQRFRIPVFDIDERLSSYAAKDLLSQATNRRIRALDDTAAAVILQSWFDGH